MSVEKLCLRCHKLIRKGLKKKLKMYCDGSCTPKTQPAGSKRVREHK